MDNSNNQHIEQNTNYQIKYIRDYLVKKAEKAERQRATIIFLLSLIMIFTGFAAAPNIIKLIILLP